MDAAIRVAVTVEQSWHRVPGGTATSILSTLGALAGQPDLELVGVAARHADAPPVDLVPPIPVQHLPLPRLALYESWHALGWPKVERATGPVDVVHATAVAIPPTDAPLVVTVHDLAFLADPTQPTRHGLRFFRRGTELARRRARLILVPSEATAAECRAVDPEADVVVVEHLWPRLHWSLHLDLPAPRAPAEVGIPDDAPFVLGLGPLGWAGGADQFVQVAGRLHREAGGLAPHFAWVGGHPEGPSHYPYRFDVERLGLAGRFHWLGERDDYHELVRRADVVVLPARRPFPLPYDPTVGWYVAEDRDVPQSFTPLPAPFAALLDVVEVPVVRWDLRAGDDLTLGRGTAIPYPDTAAMARAVGDALDRPRPTAVGRALDQLLGGGAR